MSARPRIVHVIDRLSMGGMESVALTVIERTRDTYDHVVVCLRDAGAQADRARAAGVAVHALGKQPGKDPAAYLRLVRRLRALAPDIVHTYNIGAVDIAIWARLAGCRCIVHAEHGRDAADPSGNNRKYRWLRRAMAPLIRYFVPVSVDIERWMRHSLRLPASRIRLITNGIDTTRFAPAENEPRPSPLDGLAPHTRLIGSIGRLDPVKGFDTLIEAMARLRDDARVPETHLVIVGEGPERAALEQRIARLGLGDRVSLLGQRADTPAILGALDVYVCSSIAEGIALTLLEAMAAARPIVATAVGGNPELIEEHTTGRLVPSGRPQAIADAVSALLVTPDAGAALGTAAREKAVAHYSVAAMIEGYRRLYDDVLGRPAR